jgi:hypothetical protein
VAILEESQVGAKTPGALPQAWHKLGCVLRAEVKIRRHGDQRNGQDAIARRQKPTAQEATGRFCAREFKSLNDDGFRPQIGCASSAMLTPALPARSARFCGAMAVIVVLCNWRKRRDEGGLRSGREAQKRANIRSIRSIDPSRRSTRASEPQTALATGTC